MRYEFKVDNAVHSVDIEKTRDGYRVVTNGQEYTVRILHSEPGQLMLVVGDKMQRAFWAIDGQRRWVFVDGRTIVLTLALPGSRRSHAADHGGSGEEVLRAPMPGHVRAVQVGEGDTVAKGQTLFILEAMKMEIRIQAPRSGRVKRLDVSAGQPVERDQSLGEIA